MIKTSLLILAALFVPLLHPAQAQPAPLVSSPTLTRLEALFAENTDSQEHWRSRQKRTSAFAGLVRPNLEIEDFLRNKLVQDEFWLNRDDQGSSRLALNLIANLRLGSRHNSGHAGGDTVEPNGIIAHLARHLTFRIDPKTVQVGIHALPAYFTPVVSTLMQIDGLQVRRAMVDVLVATADPNERVCALWVLQGALGELALPLLEGKNRRFKVRGEVAALDAALAIWPDLETQFANFAGTGDARKPRFLGQTPAPLPEVSPFPMRMSPPATEFQRGIARPARSNPFARSKRPLLPSIAAKN